jgi:hypothetical protein
MMRLSSLRPGIVAVRRTPDGVGPNFRRSVYTRVQLHIVFHCNYITFIDDMTSLNDSVRRSLVPTSHLFWPIQFTNVE